MSEKPTKLEVGRRYHADELVRLGILSPEFALIMRTPGEVKYCGRISDVDYVRKTVTVETAPDDSEAMVFTDKGKLAAGNRLFAISATPPPRSRLRRFLDRLVFWLKWPARSLVSRLLDPRALSHEQLKLHGQPCAFFSVTMP